MTQIDMNEATRNVNTVSPMFWIVYILILLLVIWFILKVAKPFIKALINWVKHWSKAS